MARFLERSAGLWLSQRSVHHFEETTDESGTSNLLIRPFGPDEPAVARVLETLGLPAEASSGGARFHWQSNLKDVAPDDAQAAVLVDVPDPADPSRGILYRDVGYLEAQPVESAYRMSPDGVMSLFTDYDRNHGVERCWFLTDDMRVRVGSAQVMGGVNLISYSTEIRCHGAEDFEAVRAEAEALLASLP